MTIRNNRLDRFRVATPCNADWDRMSGNERIRYCNECDKYVYDISKMTGKEAEAILSSARGPVCARFTRLTDGFTITADNNAGLHLISRRASPIASAVFTAIIGLQSSAIAQTPLQSSQPASSHSEQTVGKKKAQMQDNPTSLRGTIIDPQGAVIAGASVTLTDNSSGRARAITASETGEFQFLLLEAGSYSLKVEVPGFESFETAELALQPGEDRRVDVTMQVGQIVTLGVVIAPPQPLRILYKDSDLVAVARVGESVPVERQEESVLMRTSLAVSSLLKGEDREPVIYAYHWIYDEEQVPYVSGEKMLVFLNRRKAEEGQEAIDGYEVSDRSFRIKKLPDADLSIYTQRIKELAAILQQKKPDIEKIVEWFVRCAEEPATRWEGALELAASAARLHDLEYVSAPDEENDFANLAFAALLTPRQKDRLATALFKTETVTERDMKLIDLVKNWNDARFAPFLLSQLRRLEPNPPYFAEEMVTTLADLLDDEEATDFAEEYCDNVTYEDKEDEEATPGESTKRAATEKRSAMLQKFLRSVETKIKL
ncbi:MAG: carboxypeptidase-like regulatory domain-containing protein [Blastocatellia bacterium]|nr:carboxypeptidase-like regulatory domain-containing protein [Blastocatellia bacterium]